MVAQRIKNIRSCHIGIPHIGDSRHELIKGSLQELMMMIEPSHITLGMHFRRPQNKNKKKNLATTLVLHCNFYIILLFYYFKIPPNDEGAL